MKILLAHEDDLNAIYALSTRCIQRMREQGIDQWDAFYPNIYTFESDIKVNSLFIYKENNLIRGSIVINEKQEPEYESVDWKYPGNRICVIHRLMVDPLYQGRGIARELMHFAEYLAKERLYQAIRLDTFVNNPRALKFYQDLGYQESGSVNFRKGKFICFEKAL
jgi:ribosomal protein S18 acetylase RimI-like enzyme